MKPDGRGTSNVGIFGGKDGKPAGDATNVVTDYAFIKGEARSPEAAFATKIAKGYEDAFAKAKAEVKDHEGAHGRSDIQPPGGLPAFQAGEDSPVVQRATKALEMLGIEADLSVLQWRAGCQLARQAWRPDHHHRCRAG